MKLRFRNTIEDLVAFSRQFHEGSPLIRPQARAMAIWTFLVIVMVFFFVPWSWREMSLQFQLLAIAFVIVAAVSGAVAVCFLWKPYVLRNISKAVRKLYRHDPDKVALGERELEVVSGELIERNDFGEFRWKIGAIERIITTPDFVFIRISSMRAYVLPRQALGEQEVEAFLDELERLHRQPPPLQTLKSDTPPKPANMQPADAIHVKFLSDHRAHSTPGDLLIPAFQESDVTVEHMHLVDGRGYFRLIHRPSGIWVDDTIGRSEPARPAKDRLMDQLKQAVEDQPPSADARGPEK